MLPCVAVCCRVLQCVAVCCSVLQCASLCTWRHWSHALLSMLNMHSCIYDVTRVLHISIYAWHAFMHGVLQGMHQAVYVLCIHYTHRHCSLYIAHICIWLYMSYLFIIHISVYGCICPIYSSYIYVFIIHISIHHTHRLYSWGIAPHYLCLLCIRTHMMWLEFSTFVSMFDMQ